MLRDVKKKRNGREREENKELLLKERLPGQTEASQILR